MRIALTYMSPLDIAIQARCICVGLTSSDIQGNVALSEHEDAWAGCPFADCWGGWEAWTPRQVQACHRMCSARYWIGLRSTSPPLATTTNLNSKQAGESKRFSTRSPGRRRDWVGIANLTKWSGTLRNGPYATMHVVTKRTTTWNATLSFMPQMKNVKHKVRRCLSQLKPLTAGMKPHMCNPMRSRQSIAARGAEHEGRNPAQGSRGFGAP